MRTNIHRADTLVSRAGRSFEEIALIAYAEQLVYIVSRSFNQEEVDRFSGVLREYKIGSWCQKQEDIHRGFSYCQGDRSVRVPRINISYGMKSSDKEMMFNARLSPIHNKSSLDNGSQEMDLLYILIVQGQTGETTCKLVIEMSLENACSTMMSEALNGYSTVFTGAMLKANLGNLQDGTYTIRAVHDAKGLSTLNGNTEARVIGIWC